MNINKRTVKSVLIEHAGSFLTVKEIQATLNLEGNKAMRKISGYLSRLRSDADVERKRNSIAFTYCFKKSAVQNAYSKTTPDKKARGGSDNFEFVERLIESEEGYCELCDSYKEIAFKAEREGSIVFLCEKHGKAIKMLCEYGGVSYEHKQTP